MSYKWHVKEKTSEGQSIAFILIKKKVIKQRKHVKALKILNTVFCAQYILN